VNINPQINVAVPVRKMSSLGIANGVQAQFMFEDVPKQRTARPKEKTNEFQRRNNDVSVGTNRTYG
jgi:hypothetical protein